MLESSVDEKDKKLINILSKNSRLSYREVAKLSGLSTVTVLNRIKRLEDQGVIKKYSVTLDFEKLGYDVQVIIDIRVSKGKLIEVQKRIATDPHVWAVYDNTGHFDSTLIAKFRSRVSMDKFLKKIQSYEFVERTETKLILNTFKEGGMKIT